jgi:hypothetical protein
MLCTSEVVPHLKQNSPEIDYWFSSTDERGFRFQFPTIFANLRPHEVSPPHQASVIPRP